MNNKIKTFMVCASVLLSQSTALAALEVEITDTYYVDVKYSNENKFKRATIQISDSVSPLPVYAGEDNDVVYGSDTGYSVSFDKIKLNKRLIDGTYTIKVGSSLGTEEYSFDFINTPARETAKDNLKKAASADDVKKSFDEDYMFLNFNSDSYLSFDDVWRAKLSSAVYNQMPIDESKDFDTELELMVDTQLEIISLMCAGRNVVAVVDGLVYTNVDKTYYDMLSDKSKLGEIYAGYKSEENETVDINSILKDFDGAVLCTVLTTCDYQTAQSAFEHYENKGIIAKADKTYYDELSKSDKAEVFNLLKEKGITDYTTVCEEFKKLSKELYDEAKKESSSSDRGGSSGSGGSGMGIKYYPTPEEPDEEPQYNSETGKQPVFSDVNDMHWAKEAVEELAKEGIISGYEGGKFNPNNKITREEFVKIVVETFDKYDASADIDFSDVKNNAWYYKYVASGVKAGIINGVSEAEFGTGNNITRQDAAVILYRIYNKKTDKKVEFSDEALISDYAKEAVLALSGKSIITGMSDGKFYPKNNLTRAEAAVMIYRLKNA